MMKQVLGKLSEAKFPIKTIGWMVLLPLVCIPSFFVLFSTVRLCLATLFPSLYLDQWENALAYLNYRDAGNFWGWITASHNEHQIILYRFLCLFDWQYLGAKNYFSIFLILANQSLFVLLFYGMFKQEGRSVFLSFTIALLSIIFVFSSTQLENLNWGFQVAFVNVFLFPVLAFYFYAIRVEKQSLTYLLITITFMFFASFSMANGILVWFVAMGLSFGKKSYKDLFWFFGGLILCGYLRLYFAHSVGGESLFSKLSFQSIIPILEYNLVYLGNPLGKLNLQLAMGFSALSVLFFIYQYVVLFSSKLLNKRSVLTWVASILFILMSASATALGRFESGLMQATAERYSTPALLFSFFLFCLSILILCQKEIRRCLKIPVICWLFGFLFLTGYLLKRQTFYTFHYGNKYLDKTVALNAIQNNCNDSFYLWHLHPNMQGHLSTVLRMREDPLFEDIYSFPDIRWAVSHAVVPFEFKITKGDWISLSPIDGIGEPKMYYAGVYSTEELKGERLFAMDQHSNWVGSGYVVKKLERKEPFISFDRSGANQFIIMHFAEQKIDSPVQLYILRGDKLYALTELSTGR